MLYTTWGHPGPGPRFVASPGLLIWGCKEAKNSVLNSEAKLLFYIWLKRGHKGSMTVKPGMDWLCRTAPASLGIAKDLSTDLIHFKIELDLDPKMAGTRETWATRGLLESVLHFGREPAKSWGQGPGFSSHALKKKTQGPPQHLSSAAIGLV